MSSLSRLLLLASVRSGELSEFLRFFLTSLGAKKSGSKATLILVLVLLLRGAVSVIVDVCVGLLLYGAAVVEIGEEGMWLWHRLIDSRNPRACVVFEEVVAILSVYSAFLV